MTINDKNGEFDYRQTQQLMITMVNLTTCSWCSVLSSAAIINTVLLTITKNDQNRELIQQLMVRMANLTIDKHKN